MAILLRRNARNASKRAQCCSTEDTAPPLADKKESFNAEEKHKIVQCNEQAVKDVLLEGSSAVNHRSPWWHLSCQFAEELAESANYNTCYASREMHLYLLLKVESCFRFLLCCNVPIEDVCTCLALSSCLVSRLFEGKQFQPQNMQESTYILLIHIRLAFSTLVDVDIPVKYWHRFLFRNYCSLNQLDQALMVVFGLHDFNLTVHPSLVCSKMIKAKHLLKNSHSNQY